jgi:flagellar biosynthetic protein FlhB
MAEDMGERTEAPTSRRLSEARDRGQVAKSTDLSAAIDLIGALVVILLLGGMMSREGTLLMRRFFEELDGSIVVATVEPAMLFSLIQLAKIILPALGLLVLIAMVAQYVQVGFHPTSFPLIPKFSKLNPVKGLGNIFGARNGVKALVNSIKAIVILFVGYRFIAGIVDDFAALPVLTTGAAASVVGEAAVHLAIWLLVILLIMGLADYLYQKWQHTKDLRMTKSDIKDERRAMEGDPKIKSARFKMAQKIAMQRINSAVPKADVIVTNPTHFSVAIKYDAATMRAPKVVAKGADYLAFRIREVATRNAIPIVERPPLARALYAGVEVGQEVKPEHYQAIAEILAFVYRMEESQTAA